MKQAAGVWLPDGEQHLLGVIAPAQLPGQSAGSYQRQKLDHAMDQVGRFRIAVDIGAHCGLWSMALARRFAFVHAFEPVAENRACFQANLAGAGNVLLYANALGKRGAMVAMHTQPGSSADSWLCGPGDVTLRPLDEFDLQDVDFIKVDCCGYEYYALSGAKDTLERCKPVLIVDQKPAHQARYGLPPLAAVHFLESLGARVLREKSGDFIMGWQQ